MCVRLLCVRSQLIVLRCAPFLRAPNCFWYVSELLKYVDELWPSQRTLWRSFSLPFRPDNRVVGIKHSSLDSTLTDCSSFFSPEILIEFLWLFVVSLLFCVPLLLGHRHRHRVKYMESHWKLILMGHLTLGKSTSCSSAAAVPARYNLTNETRRKKSVESLVIARKETKLNFRRWFTHNQQKRHEELDNHSPDWKTMFCRFTSN